MSMSYAAACSLSMMTCRYLRYVKSLAMEAVQRVIFETRAGFAVETATFRMKAVDIVDANLDRNPNLALHESVGGPESDSFASRAPSLSVMGEIFCANRGKLRDNGFLDTSC